MSRPSCLIPPAVALAALIASAALAGNQPKAHDTGPFLQFSMGLGAASTSVVLNESLPSDSDNLTLDGPAADLNFAIGCIVRPNLAVHGTIWGWSLRDPTWEFAGRTGDAPDVGRTLRACGGGATYYFAPNNIYVSGSVGVAKLALEEGDGFESSGFGWALKGAVGNEWWVSDHWGLGLGLDAGYHSVPDREDATWSGWNWAVMVSATFN